MCICWSGCMPAPRSRYWRTMQRACRVTWSDSRARNSDGRDLMVPSACGRQTSRRCGLMSNNRTSTTDWAGSRRGQSSAMRSQAMRSRLPAAIPPAGISTIRLWTVLTRVTGPADNDLGLSQTISLPQVIDRVTSHSADCHTHECWRAAALSRTLEGGFPARRGRIHPTGGTARRSGPSGRNTEDRAKRLGGRL